MFGIRSKTVKRMLLINFEGMAVYGLDNSRLMKLATFDDDEWGHNKFRDYLIDESIKSIALIVDSPAEDFIIEKVVHVSVYDRKSFLNRKMDQHFRNTEYRSAKVLGREKTGRRDDRVLFSAITQTRNIDNWVNVLLQQQVSIKSITSPAFAICKVANELGLETKKETLLVNYQRNGIRQSLIANDKLMFSRLTPLPTDPDADLADSILEATLQSREYLERIGLLRVDVPPELHVVTPVLEDDAFEGKPRSADFAKVVHYNSIDLMPIDKYGGPQSEITAILLCLDWGVHNGGFGNIYASPSTMRFSFLRRQRNFIALSCALVLILGGIVSAPVLNDAIDSRSYYQAMTVDMLPLQEQYDNLTAQFPETPIPSEAMALVVNTHDLVQSQNHPPMALLSEVSQAMQQHPTISLSSIVWKLSADEQYLNVNDAILAGNAVVELELYGEQFGNSSFENADQRLREFIASLSLIEGATVRAISLPVESAPNTSVSAVVGDQVLSSEFALSVRVEG